MSMTFDELIRQPRQPVRKSRGGVISQVPEWIEEHPFVDVVFEGWRKRFAPKKAIEKEVKVVKGRRTDFTDLVTSRASGYHAVRSDQDGFRDDEDLSNIVTDFLDALEAVDL